MTQNFSIKLFNTVDEYNEFIESTRSKFYRLTANFDIITVSFNGNTYTDVEYDNWIEVVDGITYFLYYSNDIGELWSTVLYKSGHLYNGQTLYLGEEISEAEIVSNANVAVESLASSITAVSCSGDNGYGQYFDNDGDEVFELPDLYDSVGTYKIKNAYLLDDDGNWHFSDSSTLTIYEDGYTEPHLSYCLAEKCAHYNTPEIKALRFLSPNECTVSLADEWFGYETFPSVQYSTNGETWIDWDGSAVSFGGETKVYVRGNNPDGWCNMDTEQNAHFVFTGSDISVKGNIMHLLSYDEDLTALPSTYCFNGLFNDCESLSDASGLELPAITLTEACYGDMFNGCTSLVSVPKFLDTTLVNSCYRYMFASCTSLVNTPELPATTLATKCYMGMFNGCTSLVNTPVLSATTLASECYREMFYGCTSLVSTPVLPATTLASQCYNSMFNGCTSLVNLPVLPATTLATSCYMNMFANCTALYYVGNTILPATTLVDYCYQGMFEGCTNLRNVASLPATTLAKYCYKQMFKGCTLLGGLPTLPATTLVEQCYYEMLLNCSDSLHYIKMMATDVSARYCLNNWVKGVSTTGTMLCATGMSTVIPSGDSGIPSGWTVVEVAG